jgi:hypothetical protein
MLIDGLQPGFIMPQFFEFWAGTLLPLVVENREGRENRLQSRCGIEQRPSMHWLLVQESVRQSQSDNR